MRVGMKASPSTGVVYVVSGRSYLEDAIKSARSFKDLHPSYKVCFFADTTERPAVCDDFFTITDPHVRSKVDYIVRSPYDRTLFLDADTRVIGSLDDAFELLDRYEVMLCHGDNKNICRQFPRPGIPDALPYFQSGVIFFRKSDGATQLFDLWKKLYVEAGYRLDQPTLREAIWKADTKLLVLTPEYNIRRIVTILTNKNLKTDLKILHADHFNSRSKSAFRRSMHFVNTINLSAQNVALALRLAFRDPS